MSYHDEKRRKASFHWDLQSSMGIKPEDFINLRSLIRFFTVFPLSVFLSFSVLIISFSFSIVSKPWKTRGLYRRLIYAYVTYAWFEALSLLLPQKKIFITEDSDMPDGIAHGVIILNHQFDRDWWSMFAVMRCVGQHGRVKMLLPEEMRHIPLLGWALQLIEFPFLGRTWGAEDHYPLQHHLQTFQGEDETTFFLLFPEGAKLDQQTHQMSVEFAKQEGRPVLNHLLLPHIRGFQLVLEALKTTNPSVYDATMVTEGYTGGKPAAHPSRFIQFMALLLDVRPRSKRGAEVDEAVFIRIKRYSGEAVRADPKWLDRQWELKDLQLDFFARNGAFPASAKYRPSVAPPSHRRATSQNNSTASVRALGNARSGNLESSLLALSWLCILPFFCPLMITVGFPLVTVTRRLKCIKEFLFPGNKLGRKAPSCPALTSLSSPHIPQTPFCSPNVNGQKGKSTLRSRRRSNHNA